MRLNILSDDGRSLSPIAGYGLALLSFVIAWLLRVAIEPVVGDRALFLLFTLPVLVCALYAGLGPAVAAALLALGYGLYRFFADATLDVAEIGYLLTFGFVASGIILLSALLTNAQRLAAEHQARWRSETRRAERSGVELALLVEAATDYAIVIANTEGVIRIWNKGAERILGWTQDEAIGQSIAIAYPPDEVAEEKPARDMVEVLETGQIAGECWQVRKDGSEFLAEATLMPVRDNWGKLRGFSRVMRDITDRHAAKTALERREQHLQSILDTVPDAMVVIDEHGSVVSFSSAAQKTFGYDEAEVVGRNVSMLMPSPDRDRHDSYLARYLRTGERRIIGNGRIVTGLRRNGTRFPMELSVGEAKSEGERVFTGFVRDLTEKQRSDTRIRELQSELIHTDRLSAMGSMASTLAHELNQPLTAIANYAEAAGPMIGAQTAEEKEILNEIFRELTAQSMRAGNIVRRLREFISRGEIEKRVEDLPALVSDALALALVGTREKGVWTDFDFDPAATPVLVDRVQIQQVLVNLIRNAVEAMEDSAVRKLTIATRLDGDERVAILISDTGPGLPPDVAAQLFQAFVTTKSSGMGLGLSICQTIVEAHGGRIKGMNPAEGGAQFQVILPRVTQERL